MMTSCLESDNGCKETVSSDGKKRFSNQKRADFEGGGGRKHTNRDALFSSSSKAIMAEGGRDELSPSLRKKNALAK